MVNHLSENDHLEWLWSYIWPLKPLDVGADGQTDGQSETSIPPFNFVGGGEGYNNTRQPDLDYARIRLTDPRHPSSWWITRSATTAGQVRPSSHRTRHCIRPRPEGLPPHQQLREILLCSRQRTPITKTSCKFLNVLMATPLPICLVEGDACN